jgi:glutamine amidotransferase
MCRHLAHLGPPRTLAEVVIDPPHGLYRQAWEPRLQRHGTVNADGFGVGWYPDGAVEPARYRRAVPVWADANLPDLARVLRTRALLAAVRDATPGTSQDESAAAPFRSGRWLFSHNGAVPDWQHLPADLDEQMPPDVLLSLDAHSDSALLWALIRSRLEAGEPLAEALAAVTERTAAARPAARLNLLLTDGETIAATRWGDTLWYRTGPDGVVVASEPDGNTANLSGSGWREVPDRSLLLATTNTVRIKDLRTEEADAA